MEYYSGWEVKLIENVFFPRFSKLEVFQTVTILLADNVLVGSGGSQRKGEGKVIGPWVSSSCGCSPLIIRVSMISCEVLGFTMRLAFRST